MDKMREIEIKLNRIENQIKDVVLDDLKPEFEIEFEVNVLKQKRDLILKQAISLGLIPTWESGVWKLAEGIQSYSMIMA